MLKMLKIKFFLLNILSTVCASFCLPTAVFAQSISEYELTLAAQKFPAGENGKHLYETYCNFVRDAHALNNVNPDSAQVLYMQCDSFLLKNNLKSIRQRLLLDYGFQRSRISDADEALRVCSMLDKEGLEKDNYFFSFCYYRIKSQSFKAQNKLKDAIENGLIAKQKLTDGDAVEKDKKKSAYNKFFIINIQSDLSNLFKDTQQFEKSVQVQQDNLQKINEISSDVLRLADKADKDRDLYLANSYNNLSVTLITKLENSQNPKPDTSIVSYLNKAIEIEKRINNLVFLGSSYFNFSNYYNIIEDYPNRKLALEKSLEVNTQLNNEVGLIYCKSDLSSTLVKLNDSPAKALQLAQEALDGVRQQPEFGNKGGIYMAYCEALSYNGRISEAILYFDTANTFKTTELKSTFDKEITEMQTKYETAEKEKQIIKQDSEIKQKKAQMNLLYGGVLAFAIIALLAYRSYLHKKKANVIIQRERDRSENLLLNILPAETAEELKEHGKTQARSYDNCTVMFTDFKDFTKVAEKLTPQQLVSEIDFCFKEFDRIISKYNIEKIKTIGDAYMCAANLPKANPNHASDIVNAAVEIRDFMQQLQNEREAKGIDSFKIRIGVHSGPLVAGVVGTKKFAYDVWGDTVNTASRMESSGEAGKVNISGTTYELIKDQFNCGYRGKVQAKNKGEIDMYFIEQAAKPLLQVVN